MRENVFVGLDIGTTKIACIISEVDENSELKVIGIGVSPSKGLRKGVVINIDQTVKSIKQAVEEAELMAGIDVEDVFVGIAGDHILAVNSKGVTNVKGENNIITAEDLERAKDSASAVSIPMDREVLHVIAQEYIVDNQPGIKNPIGMSATRLEAQVHIITGAVESANNIRRSVEKAGLNVIELVLEPIASSYSVLEPDEKELGVVLIDMGGGTTDVAMYYDNSFRHTAVVAHGGQNVTKDIAICMRTPVDKAEEIKKEYGCAYPKLVGMDEFVNVPGVGGREQREVSRSVLASIIEPRLEEILLLTKNAILKTDFSEKLGAGIVLTGGGSLIDGMQELAERVFEQPVKLGVPQGFGGLTEVASSPMHATGVGLCKYALKNIGVIDMKKPITGDDSFGKIVDKMKSWVKEYF